MQYQYDSNEDCAYIQVSALPHAYSKELDDARFVDYAADGTVIGVELLYVSGGVDISGLPREHEVGELLKQHGVAVTEA